MSELALNPGINDAVGNFDGIYAGCATGWVANGVGGSKAHVCICSSDHELIAWGAARVKRPDLAGSGAGFSILLPDHILHNPGEFIFAKICREDEFLPGSPAQITPASPYQLNLDGFVTPGLISGWIKDRTRPDELIQLELWCDGKAIAWSDSSLRIDENIGTGRFSFELPDDFRDGEIRSLEIRLAAVGILLLSFPILALPDDSSGVRLADFPFLATPAAEKLPAVLIEKRNILKSCGAFPDDNPASSGADMRSAASCDRLCEAARRREEEGLLTEALEIRELAAKAMPGRPEPHAGIIYCLYHLAREREALYYLDSLPSHLRKTPLLLEWKRRLESLYRDKSAKIIAFYLPQFHPIPENDRWWGAGFTEWSNVASAQPLFTGHEQPRIPRDIGYYDLRLAETANAQFDLARKYGIDGFCYYYYWFNGKRLLEKPLDDLVSGRTGPFPFCICWANESWTRSWDGASGEFLIRQTHTLEADARFIEDALPYLAHPAYIRHDDKAIILVYRADKMADPAKTAKIWRQYCRNNGVGEILLCYVNSFCQYDNPKSFGFDASVEFPPHYRDICCCKEIKIDRSANDMQNKNVHVYDYQTFCTAFMEQEQPEYTTFHTSMLAWDNTPRRKQGGTVYHGFKPQLHKKWLWRNLARGTREQGNTLVFINAWNEWAEGAVLEPDNLWGYENLELTRAVGRAASYAWHDTFWKNGIPGGDKSSLPKPTHILLVGHDAFPYGAQLILLNIAKTMKQDLFCNISTVLLSGGPLVQSYARYGEVFVVDYELDVQKQLDSLVGKLHGRGLRHAICNTCATGAVSRILVDHGFKVVNLVHELPAIVAEHGLELSSRQMAKTGTPVVFPASMVGNEFCSMFWPSLEKVIIMPQGINDSFFDVDDNARDSLRRELNIGEEALVAVGCGYGDYRKGIDLFLLVADKVIKLLSPRPVAFIWIGEIEPRLLPYVNEDIRKMGLEEAVRITGLTGDPGGYFQAADVFALTSREDPYPSVVMEAIGAGLPVVAFMMGGGYTELVNSETGRLVPYLDVAAMADAIVTMADKLKDGSLSHTVLRIYARQHFSYKRYAECLRQLFDPLQLRKSRKLYSSPPVERWHFSVSVIVPNFNYARYLELRLRTILDQTLPPCEIIVLDDCSTDSSMEIITRVIQYSRIPVRIIRNEHNSDSVFHQWLKGIEIAKGELIWIAEADDYCELNMLEQLVPEFNDPEIVFAFSDSIAVDGDGKSSNETYQMWYKDKVKGVSWDHDLKVDGCDMLKNALLYYNCVPNASAVVFRKSCLPDNMQHMTQFRYSGDWWLWAALAARGKVSYLAEPMNYHRRHLQSRLHCMLKDEVAFMKEAIEDFISLVKLNPDLIDMRVTFEILRQIEKMYSCLNRQRSECYYLKNNKMLQPGYARLMSLLRPEQYIESCVKKGSKILVIELVSNGLSEDTKSLIFWLNRQTELTVHVIGKIIRANA